MFNVRDTKFVPAFNVREPVEEIPGFRVAPDGSILQGSTNVPSATGQSLGGPDSWLQPWSTSKPGTTSNLAFLGSGLAGILGASTPSALQDVDPVAAGDLRCQKCASGGDYGTTGAYRIEDRILCQKCAVKHLGFGNEPSSTQPGLLRPWLIDRK
jgi:hypothetical protein